MRAMVAYVPCVPHRRAATVGEEQDRVEFLHRTLSAKDDDDSLLSGAMEWGAAGPCFLTGAEEGRIKAAGQDPWPDDTE
ncbi:hypothetical protein [Streptomyces sp. NPDC002845]